VNQHVLPHGKYFTAIGSITDAAIFRLIADILALPDITEVESHRLSELCRILNALEGLFSENDGQVSPLLNNHLFSDMDRDSHRLLSNMSTVGSSSPISQNS
jgi:hypothetical protein